MRNIIVKTLFKIKNFIAGMKKNIMICKIDHNATINNVVQDTKNDIHYMLNVNTSGNTKLKNSKERRFIIWNLPAIVTCPYATENCARMCYARKAEKMYPSVLPSRNRNLDASLQDNFIDRMFYTISQIMSRPIWSNCKQVIFRIHESGDFYSQAYADKWKSIIKKCKRHFKNLVFMAYTKSFKFFDGFQSSNFVKRASIWNDTRKEDLDYIKKNNLPVYTAADKQEMKNFRLSNVSFTHCKCNNCGTCEKHCFTNRRKLVIVDIH